MSAVHAVFGFTDDVPGIYSKWLELVRLYQVSGKQIHDANHVAAMIVHGITMMLTLDDRDFARYEEIEVVKPK